MDDRANSPAAALRSHLLAATMQLAKGLAQP